jgi:hypothetical protein
MSRPGYRLTGHAGEETLSVERDRRPDMDLPEAAEYRGAELITLLRSGNRAPPAPDAADLLDHEGPGDGDDLDGARGLAIAVVLGVILWFGIIWVLVRVWWAGVP